MNLHPAALRPSRTLRSLEDGVGRVAPYVAVAAAAALLGVVAVDPDIVRFGIAALAALVFFIASLRAPRAVLMGAIVWLVALGFSRRIISGFAADAVNDPLLLIAPAAAVALLISATSQPGAFRLDSALSRWVAAFSVVVVFGALNPLQGSLVAGLAGLLFFLVPMLWFWIGRAFLDAPTLRTVLRLLGFLAIVAAAYGIFQALVGFPSWDQRWIDSRESILTSLVVAEGSLRQFGPFTSAQEHAVFLAMGVAVWLAALLATKLGPVAIVPAAVCVVALSLVSIRGSLIAAVVAAGLMVATRLRLPIGVTVAIGAVAVLGLITLAGTINTVNLGDSSTQALLDRTVSGVSDPFDSDTSTLPVHLSLTGDALTDAVTSAPLGRGLSTASLAGRLGTGSSGENDIARVALSMGIPGLICYLGVVVAAVRTAWRSASRHRTASSLAVGAILVVTGAQWLNGALYAVSPIVWLLMGSLDRAADEETENVLDV